MRYALYFATALVINVLVACSHQEVAGTSTHVVDSRFHVAYQSSFTRMQTRNDHGIFIVTDTKTGQEYLAIEGCGVSVIVKTDKNREVEQ